MNYLDLPTAEVDRSQFIGNSLKNSVVFLVLHSLQGQESWFPRPKSFTLSVVLRGASRREGFSCNIYLLAWFSLMALMVKISAILPENSGDSSSIQNLFLLCKKSILDTILIPHSQSPPYDIEGGDLRDTLKFRASYTKPRADAQRLLCAQAVLKK